MTWLHMEGCYVGVTKMHEGYMWKGRQYVQQRHMQVRHGGHSEDVTNICPSYTWNVTRNFNLKFNLIHTLV